MKKIILLLLLLLPFTSLYAQDDTITILTYYPSPYGAYQNLQVKGKLTLDATTTATTGIIYTGDQTFIHHYGGPTNFFAGNLAGNLSLTGTSNTGIGNQSMYSNATGAHNTAVGYLALNKNTSGNYNTAIGDTALYENITTTGNTAVGYSALRNNIVNGNTALGYQAMYNNITGYQNTAVGYQALYSNRTWGWNNTAIGYQSLRSNTAHNNTAVGSQALYYNSSTGIQNTAVGAGALYSNSTGAYNTAIGAYALNDMTNGSHNVAIGAGALDANSESGQTEQSFNVAIGYQALGRHKGGDSNTVIGSNAGWMNTTGTGNVFVGYWAGYNETGSYKLYIEGNMFQTDNPLIYGDFGTRRIGINRKILNYTLEVGGDINTTTAIRRNGSAYNNPFTGHHRFADNALVGKIETGDAVILENGKISRSQKPYDKRVIGIYTGKIELEFSDHTEWVHLVAGLGDSTDSDSAKKSCLIGFKVCNEGGNISSGDLLTTSSRPGYSMKQNDDIVHSYTVGKAGENAEFNENGTDDSLYGFIYAGG